MDYWSQTLAKRIARRRALGGAATLAAGALAAGVIGCGGGNEGGAQPNAGGLVARPVDSTKQAVRGGIMTLFRSQDSPHFDHMTGDNLTHDHTTHVYSRLLRFKPGSVDDPPVGAVDGDAASHWEVSSDGLQVTMKLRPNNKLDARPPTNGRALNAQDVKYSWERFEKVALARVSLAKSASPDAPIDSVSYPDNMTVVWKLAYPLGHILKALAFNRAFMVMPIEADGKYDVKNDMRGAGAWILTKYEPSVGHEYRRNPNWFDADKRPFLDGIDYPIIPQAATQLAQFKAKRLWSYAPVADQALTLKRESPETLMLGTSPTVTQAGYNHYGTSRLPDAPFWDVRMRYAVSLLLDRETFIEAFGNISGLAKEGVAMETAWHSHIPAGWGGAGYWLDPKANKLGAISQYFHYNPDEAAKLMRAAGKFGYETEFSFNASGTADYKRRQEVVAEMLQKGGHFKLKVASYDYNTIYNPKYFFGKLQWEGIAPVPFGSWPDIFEGMWAIYSPTGRNDYVYKEVPNAHQTMVKLRTERDDKKRIELVHQWQREMAAEMPSVPEPGVWTTFTLNWPWLGNGGYYIAYNGQARFVDEYTHLWYDKSKDTRSA